MATGAENYSLQSVETPVKDRGGIAVHCHTHNDTHLSGSLE